MDMRIFLDLVSGGRGRAVCLGLIGLALVGSNDAQAFPPATDAGTSSQIIAVTPQIDMVRMAIQERLAPRGRRSSIALAPGVRGMAAGEEKGGYSGWAGYSGGEAELQGPEVRSSIDVSSISLGYDLAWSKTVTAGVSLSLERSRMRYWFSLPGARGEGHVVSLAPYVGWSIAPGLTADLILGFARGENDHVMDPDTRVFAGSQGVRRQILAASLNQQWQRGSIEWAVRGGVLGTRQRNQAYLLGPSAVDASDSDTTRLQLGLQATHVGGSFLPYAGITHAYDLARPSDGSLGRSGTMLSLGALWTPHRALTASLSYQREVGRSGSDNDLFMLNLMARF
jgi:hypothetical protein